MAECVSCGRNIPPGRLFCDDCYRKMKGRKGPLKEAEVPAEAKPVEAAASPPVQGEVAERPQEQVAVAPAGIPEGVKKARLTLTPPSGKKVVSLKPDLDHAEREKERGGGRKFTVSITFSERTYAALHRLKRKKGGEAGKAQASSPQAADAALPGPAKPLEEAPRKAGRKGPYGRAVLKAVKAAPPAGGPQKGVLRRAVGYRARRWDGRDRAGAVMATLAAVLALAMFFLEWVKFTAYEGEGGVPTTAYIKGASLGPLAYLALVSILLSWLYMVVGMVMKKPLVDLDFGAVMIVLGMLAIILIYVILASSGLMAGAAGRIAGRGEGLKQSMTGYARQVLWPSYLMVLGGALMAFAGLMRLSERKA
jgi:hypothetical protein